MSTMEASATAAGNIDEHVGSSRQRALDDHIGAGMVTLLHKQMHQQAEWQDMLLCILDRGIEGASVREGMARACAWAR